MVVKKWWRYACSSIAGIALFSSNAHADLVQVKLGYASSAMSLVTAPWLAASELGFFKEQGIDLRWVVLNGGANAIQQTLNKSIDITYPSANELLIVGKQQGRQPLPLRFFYLGFPRNIWQYAVPENSPIKSFADLRGKKVGVFSSQAAYLPQLRALARSAGVNPATDMQIRVVGVGAGALQALRSGQTDVSAQAEVQHAAFEAMGENLRLLPTSQLVDQLHGPGFLTHEDNLRDPKRRAIMVAVARAMAMGTLFCQTNPEECVRLSWKAVPTLRPSGDPAKAMAT